MKKKFGGVRVTMQRVVDRGVCAGCGQAYDLCVADWEARLKIHSHASDTSHSAYKDNVAKIRRAVQEGLDPFCMRANLGYLSTWTPHRPPGSFDPTTNPYRKSAVGTPTKTSGGTLGKNKGVGTKRGVGRGKRTGRSGR